MCKKKYLKNESVIRFIKVLKNSEIFFVVMWKSYTNRLIGRASQLLLKKKKNPGKTYPNVAIIGERC